MFIPLLLETHNVKEAKAIYSDHAGLILPSHEINCASSAAIASQLQLELVVKAQVKLVYLSRPKLGI
jgi:hypothetical protein